MADVDEWEYVSIHYSKERLQKWIKDNEPWRKLEEEKIYTEKELFGLNKDEQIELLNSLGVDEIPRYEKDRVNKILEIQNKTPGGK